MPNGITHRLKFWACAVMNPIVSLARSVRSTCQNPDLLSIFVLHLKSLVFSTVFSMNGSGPLCYLIFLLSFC